MPPALSVQDRLREGMALRVAQHTEAALDVIADLARAVPDDAAVALANARIHFDTWRPAAALFERAMALAPGNPAAIAGLAMALAAEGDGAGADTLLSSALARQQGWIAGHQQLAQLRITSGASEGFDRSFAAACQAEPDTVALRLAWFQALVTARHWPMARRVIADGIARMGPIRAFALARIFLASESDEASRDPHLFDAVADVRDVGLDLARVRFWLRNDRPDTAAAIAEAHAEGTAARTFWPYLSLAWRLLGDARAGWLDGDPAFLATTDLALSIEERGELARVLRGLLTMAAPFPEQSVRGGVQTGRHLFFNPNPVIQSVRRRATTVIRAYIDALPPVDPRHPLLAGPRDAILYDGSWAVLLAPAGHHAAHTHNRGWISSALHVELPDPDTDARPRDGWLAFGTPPAELGLDLPATSHVEPKAGQLALFPSTTWHRTIPFAKGDRLTIAFDVQR